MCENDNGIKPSLSTVCEESVARYRESGKGIQSPAIRKVLESVIRQKSEHGGILRPFDALFKPDVAPARLPPGNEPEEVLRVLAEYEKSFAASMDEFSASLADEEARRSVKAVAEASRKFSSWAQDHLDLLSLF